MLKRASKTKVFASQDVDRGKLEEMVRERAFTLCQKRGCSPGNELADWFEAERQLKKEMGI